MRAFLLVLSVVVLVAPARATPITYTGAELAALPGASFPTGGQSIVGDALGFEPTLFNGILYRLDLDDFIVDPSTISFSVELPRLLNDDGELDQDIIFGIYDGQNLFNTVVDGEPSGQVRPIHRVDGLNATETQLGPNSFIQGASSFSPSPLGSITQLDVTIQATPTSTTLISEINQAGALTSTISTVLDTSAGLSLFIIGNETNENHLINSFTFTSGVSLPAAVPEPGALGGLALGLGVLGFGLYRRRFV